MRKKVLSAALMAAVVAVAGYGVYVNHKSEIKLSDVALENVEALASNEYSKEGTLYGNSEGSRFCCCAGSRICGAEDCSNC